MSAPLISAECLLARLGEPGLRILDGTWFMPDSGRDARAEYAAEHLPGAVFFDIDAIADTASDLPHMLPTPERFALAVGALGVGNGDTVVVYGRAPVPSSARVWWSLRAMGLDAVQVLDGGLAGWRAVGGHVESGEVTPPAARFTARFRPELVRDYDATLAALQSGGAQMVDARLGARFRGEQAEPRPGLRSGHAPGSRSLPASSLYDGDGRLLASATLEARLAEAGVDPSRPVVATCGSGVTAASIALALARLGRFDTAVYDGSWAEWGARPDAPVVTGHA